MEQPPQPERHYRHSQLIYLLGYYALILETINLAPDWRTMYQERLEEIEAEIKEFESGSHGA